MNNLRKANPWIGGMAAITDLKAVARLASCAGKQQKAIGR